MKRKIFHKDFVANLKDGSTRHVLIVGVLDRTKKFQLSQTPVLNENNEVTGTAFVNESCLVKRLTLLYTICDPEDEFDLQTGIELAMNRVNKKYLGVIESSDFTMLRNEHVNALLDSEVEYIKKNIDKIVAKKEKERCRKRKQRKMSQK